MHTIGQATWFEVVTDASAPPARPRLRMLATPNPVADEARITVEGWETQALQLTVLDARGRAVMHAAGSGSVRLQRGALPAGVYFVRVENATGGAVTGKIIIR